MTAMLKARGLVCVSLLCAAPYAAAVNITANDFGMSGALQTPSARMRESGDLSLSISQTTPYTRLNLILQPFDWLQGGFRYVDVSNLLFDPTGAIAGNQSYKDKGIDVKFRVAKETRRLPEIAVGIQDVGGTGLFAGEYVVGSKRYRQLDISAGLGWGYLGATGDFGNPLGINDRPTGTVQNGGSFNTNQYFRGRVSPFASLQYQPEFSAFIFKLEYEGNDYQSESFSNNQKQSSPFNAGVVWQAAPFFDLQVALERGNTAMVGLTFHTNLAKASIQPRRYDPAPEPIKTAVTSQETVNEANLQAWLPTLEEQAGLSISNLSLRNDELIIQAESQRYRHGSEAADRVARVLNNRVPSHIRWFTLQQELYGLTLLDASIDRQLWLKTQLEPTSAGEKAAAIQADAPALRESSSAPVHYKAPLKRGSGGVGLGYQQTLGGPDGFVLYQLSVNAEGEYRLAPGLWLNGVANYRFFDNYDNFNYTGPSKLQRVRTFAREYLTTSTITVPNAQITGVTALAPDVYAMAYAGYLESMFAGVGGEVLYRPFGRGVAFGVDVNYVQQREFDQLAGFCKSAQDNGKTISCDYRVLTSHASLYWRTGWQGVLATLKAGRYLAKDVGVTLDMSRQFPNGVEMGAYATVTDAGKAFGEGSFDKGIYVRVPFDLFLPKATRSVASINWSPLTRDGGALLNRKYTLHGLTEQREPALFKRP
ncbi:MAG: YjbH domain-containing protein [Pseudomonadota bacterium]